MTSSACSYYGNRSIISFVACWSVELVSTLQHDPVAEVATVLRRVLDSRPGRSGVQPDSVRLETCTNMKPPP